MAVLSLPGPGSVLERSPENLPWPARPSPKAARGEEPGSDLQRQRQRHSDSVRASICPYRELLHFREEDAPFFFGRRRVAAIDKLLETVQRQAFVAVVGASGNGKSSVVRAGLVPRLRSKSEHSDRAVVLLTDGEDLEDDSVAAANSSEGH